MEDNNKKKARHIMRVKVAEEDFYHIDEELPLGDVWCETFLDEKEADSTSSTMSTSIPMKLWSDNPLDIMPGPPGWEVDEIAEEAEVKRLMSMHRPEGDEPLLAEVLHVEKDLHCHLGETKKELR